MFELTLIVDNRKSYWQSKFDLQEYVDFKNVQLHLFWQPPATTATALRWLILKFVVNDKNLADSQILTTKFSIFETDSLTFNWKPSSLTESVWVSKIEIKTQEKSATEKCEPQSQGFRFSFDLALLVFDLLMGNEFWSELWVDGLPLFRSKGSFQQHYLWTQKMTETETMNWSQKIMESQKSENWWKRTDKRRCWLTVEVGISSPTLGPEIVGANKQIFSYFEHCPEVLEFVVLPHQALQTAGGTDRHRFVGIPSLIFWGLRQYKRSWSQSSLWGNQTDTDTCIYGKHYFRNFATCNQTAIKIKCSKTPSSSGWVSVWMSGGSLTWQCFLLDLANLWTPHPDWRQLVRCVCVWVRCGVWKGKKKPKCCSLATLTKV